MAPLAFESPLTIRRPHGSYRFDVFSLKAGRRMTLFGKAAVSQFIELEADHEVTALCERPLKIPDSKPMRVIDFWALQGGRSHFYLLLSASGARDMSKPKVATEGGLFYTESMGFELDGAIEIGESGLYSPGLRRVASGTLIVAGPMDLVQEQWEENKSKLIALSNLAESGARILLTCRTPEPEQLHQDIAALLRMEHDPSDFVDHSLAGNVTEKGQLNVVSPFVGTRRTVVGDVFSSVVPAWPERASQPILNALRKGARGLLIAGTDHQSSSEGTRPRTAASLLPDVTALLGPAALVMDSFSPGYDPVPEVNVLQQLPVLPSVQAALDAGYNVIVCEAPYRETLQAIMANAERACFITTARAMWAGRAFEHSTVSGVDPEAMFKVLIAIVSWTDINAGKSGLHELWDVYVHDRGKKLPVKALRKSEDFIQDNRVVRWEDQVFEVIGEKKITRRRVRTLFPYLKLPSSPASPALPA